MTTHTSAPWVDDNSREYYKQRVIRHNGVIIATISEPTAGLSVDEVAANAPLLAAAPEMYELLAGVIEAITPLLDTDPNGEKYEALWSLHADISQLQDRVRFGPALDDRTAPGQYCD